MGLVKDFLMDGRLFSVALFHSWSYWIVEK